MTRRVAITGLGPVTAAGIGKDQFWGGLEQARSFISPIERYDATKYAIRIAGQVLDFNPRDWADSRVLVQTDRFTHLAFAAAKLALEDAGLDLEREDRDRVSVILASGSGGNEFGQKEIQNLWSKGALYVGAYQSIAWFYAASVGQISIKYKITGRCMVLVAESAGGLNTLAEGTRLIRRGVSDVALVGGSEAPLSPYALACLIASDLLSTRADPARAYRPFDAARTGFVPGEGGACLVLEALDRALARGAPIYAEVIGYGETSDGYHPFEPAPDGVQYGRAMRLAMQRAGIGPSQIGALFTDAVGTPEGDRIEARAIARAFGDRAATVPVSVPKAAFGRLLAGAGGADAVAACLALRDGLVPPTINFDERDPACDLNVVTGAPGALDAPVVMVAARGFGGFNAAVILRRHGA